MIFLVLSRHEAIYIGFYKITSDLVAVALWVFIAFIYCSTWIVHDVYAFYMTHMYTFT
jgi:hypothetical protein